MKKYLVGSVLITLALFVFSIAQSDIGVNLHPLFDYLIVFFFIQSVLISILLGLGEKDQEKFPFYALGSVVLRLLTAIMALIILYLVGVENAKSLSIQFMGVYLLFLVFELTVVLSNLRRN